MAEASAELSQVFWFSKVLQTGGHAGRSIVWTLGEIAEVSTWDGEAGDTAVAREGEVGDLGVHRPPVVGQNEPWTIRPEWIGGARVERHCEGVSPHVGVSLRLPHRDRAR